MEDMYYSTGPVQQGADLHAQGFFSGGGGSSMGSPYTDLATAIVHQAVTDYIKIIRKLWTPNLSMTVKRRCVQKKMEIEAFFHSSWYEMLCDIDPDKVIVNCHRRAEERERESIKRRNQKKVQQLVKAAELQKESESETANNGSGTTNGGIDYETGKNIV